MHNSMAASAAAAGGERGGARGARERAVDARAAAACAVRCGHVRAARRGAQGAGRTDFRRARAAWPETVIKGSEKAVRGLRNRGGAGQGRGGWGGRGRQRGHGRWIGVREGDADAGVDGHVRGAQGGREGHAAGGRRAGRAGWRLASARFARRPRDAQGAGGMCGAADTRGPGGMRCKRARGRRRKEGNQNVSGGEGTRSTRGCVDPEAWVSACCQCLSRRAAQSGVWTGPHARECVAGAGFGPPQLSARCRMPTAR